METLAFEAFANGELKDGRALLQEAAKLRGCYEEQQAEIPEELLNPTTTIIYTSDAESMGAPSANRKELAAYIDSIPDIPELVRDRVKEDSGIKKKNLLKRMMDDAKEFGEDND